MAKRRAITRPKHGNTNDEVIQSHVFERLNLGVSAFSGPDDMLANMSKITSQETYDKFQARRQKKIEKLEKEREDSSALSQDVHLPKAMKSG